MPDRVHNFNPGPAVLPYEVLEECARGALNFNNLGMSIMEISHRSKDFEAVLDRAQKDMLELMGLSGDEYAVMFLGGGASMQFCMIPYNFLNADATADYVNTGEWSTRAIKEAKLFGKVNVAASSEDANFNYVPTTFNLTPGAAYVHTTSNNTIFGTRMKAFPETGGVPHICDMSSDFLSRRLDFSRFSIIYAGAQKNIGPSGTAAVIARKSFIEKAKDGLPTMLSYKTHLKGNSLYNTPPVFPIYVVGLVLAWLKNHGGIDAMEKINEKKAALLYSALDSSDGFFRGTVRPDSRSIMNVTFRLPSEELEEKFVSEAKKQGLIGLKGHRSVGGCRASLYNALPVEAVEALTAFMASFRKAN
ncbi:MAG TPA: 3-phosphoserine/phosphohydroxythreonine transaminase [Candidatus Fermentibacter sp.]|nr:3-phosphoserine/phosphohydroxythreonine transaminase [Candidatus Fermentibacter sp.]